MPEAADFGFEFGVGGFVEGVSGLDAGTPVVWVSLIQPFPQSAMVPSRGPRFLPKRPWVR